MTAHFARNARVAWQIIVDGEAVLVDLASGATLGLNETGGLIWSRIDEDSTEEIGNRIAQRFHLNPSEARRDVEEFITVLESKGLIVRKESR